MRGPVYIKVERHYNIMIHCVRLLSEYLSSDSDSGICWESDLGQFPRLFVISTARFSHGGTDGDVTSQAWEWGGGRVRNESGRAAAGGSPDPPRWVLEES